MTRVKVGEIWGGRWSPVFLLLYVCFLIQTALQLDIDNCKEDLGLENGKLGDEVFSASSSYDPTNVGPSNARLNNSGNGGAWCPREPVSREKGDQWLQVNFTITQVISVILTQGRFAKGLGKEYTQAYRVQYWREGMMGFKEYHHILSGMILPGNTDTFSTAASELNPPILASAIRILPYSNQSRTVCLRVGLMGCPFTEGIQSYNIPQGMVRASLELLDITYDGSEDSTTGFLRGGIGQLVDGKYGSENFKATGENGLVKGYEWVGWKNKSMGPLQMDFTFNEIRKFHQLSIHINNHYTRDIQIFSRAKIYFSNEEGKFGDDRSVDYFYMPDQMLEDARNVTINLNGEHGKFIMIQLFFSSKWILISEVTFESDIYEEKPFSTKDPGRFEWSTRKPTLKNSTTANPPAVVSGEEKKNSSGSELGSGLHTSVLQIEETDEEAQSHYLGLVIGILITIISLLLMGIVFVLYRGRRGKGTPSGSLLPSQLHEKIAASIDFKDMTTSYTPYKSKMRVYGQVPATESQGLNGNIYANPAVHGQLVQTSYGLAKKFPSDPVLSDCTDDYAEPQQALVGLAQQSSTFYSDYFPPHNIYSQATIPPVNQYAKPLSPVSRPDCQSFLQRQRQSPPPQRQPPPKTLMLAHVYSSNNTRRSNSTQKHESLSLSSEDIVSPSQSSFSSADRTFQGTNISQKTETSVPHYTKVRKHKSKNAGSWQDTRQCGEALVNHHRILSSRQEELLSSTDQPKTFVERSQLKIVEKIGRGQFGEVHLCHLVGNFNQSTCLSSSNISGGSSLVAVKSLDPSCSLQTRVDFEREAQILSEDTNPNIARVLGINMDEPGGWFLVSEYSDQGDLNQYLQDHVAEYNLAKSPGVATLSYGALIYMATQISSGMKWLESMNYVHKDLATRNCLVYPGYQIKVSDCGAAKSLYSDDYYSSTEAGKLPIRWMAWESVLLAVYTSKSDVWSFGVTLWEILTFVREQPYEALSDEKVIENVSHLYESDSLLYSLPQPYKCPRDVFDLILECWQKNERERPNFTEIHLFLQRKNLGFSPEQN